MTLAKGFKAILDSLLLLLFSSLEHKITHNDSLTRPGLTLAKSHALVFSLTTKMKQP